MAGNLTAMIASIFSGSAVSTDPYFNYTTLLLPGNGTNGAQNNTFLDSSSNNFTITRNGNTTQGTFSPFSQTGWGNYFDGTGDYLTVSSNAAFGFGTGDFTIEYWIYPSLTGDGNQVVIDARSSPSAIPWLIGQTTGGAVRYYDGTTVRTGGTMTANTWNHVAWCRASNVNTVYLNGTSVSTYTASQDFGSSNPLTLGSNVSTSTERTTGYVSNLRIVKGTAVYTSNFTPPVTPLTAISGTSLLTCQSNRFKDSSSNAFAITSSGGPTVVAFSPFAPTAAWSSTTNGGSGYFDGNGDFLQVSDNVALRLGTSAYTVEFWWYPTSSAASQVFMSKATTGDGSPQPYYAWSTGRFYWYSGTTDIFSTPYTVVLNQWYHVAYVRTSTLSNDTRLYINGSLVAASTDATNYTSTAVLNVGGQGGGTYCVNGYLSDFRIVKGTAITPPAGGPTAPLTNITNTSLLLNFTNAGVYDATSKNDLETVGNAQISSTTAKWGSTSISFDGTGDWLLIPDQPQQRIGTGNFTVEMWVYRNSSGTYGLVGKGTGTTGWLVSLNSSNQVVFTYGSSTITSTGTISATTWTHIAVVREGTSTNQTKIYINGTNDGTGTVSTDFNQTNSMYVGADRTGGSAANAYVQDVRITNYARYTANFTAPTAAFPLL